MILTNQATAAWRETQDIKIKVKTFDDVDLRIPFSLSLEIISHICQSCLLENILP